MALAAKRLEEQSDEEETPNDEEKFVNVNRKNQVPKKKGFDEPENDDDEEDK